MLQFNIKQAKRFFFDGSLVMRRVKPATRKALFRAGGYIRKRALWLMPSAKGSSKPGKPPHAHKKLLKTFMFFVVDPMRENVVIGPARLEKPGIAPKTLEEGGETVVTRRVKGKLVSKRVTIAARPFMGPAYELTKRKIAPLWQNSVK